MASLTDNIQSKPRAHGPPRLIIRNPLTIGDTVRASSPEPIRRNPESPFGWLHRVHVNHHTLLISTSTATNNENLLTGTSVEADHYPCIIREIVGSPCIIRECWSPCIIRYIAVSREPSYLAGIAVPDANRSVGAAGVELVGTQRQRNPTDSLTDFMITVRAHHNC